MIAKIRMIGTKLTIPPAAPAPPAAWANAGVTNISDFLPARTGRSPSPSHGLRAGNPGRKIARTLRAGPKLGKAARLTTAPPGKTPAGPPGSQRYGRLRLTPFDA